MQLALTPSGEVRAVVLRTGIPAAGQGVVERAGAFLRVHATAFGLLQDDVQLVPARVVDGRFVHFRQLIGGVPVWGSRIVVQVEDRGVVFVLARVAREEPAVPLKVLDPAPLSGDSAAEGTRRHVVFAPEVLGLPGAPRPAWEVVPPPGSPAPRLVADAVSGATIVEIPSRARACSREVLDGAGLAGVAPVPVRVEGEPATGIPDADMAYDVLGDVHSYLDSAFGRDGLDGAGGTMTAVVRYCERAAECPFAGSYWSLEDRHAVFGDGLARADDVVAHEAMHGMISFDAGLLPWGEPGSIAEALADYLGEIVDQQNGRGDDGAAVRWLIGEDVTVLRDMDDPASLGHPDRRLSPLWEKGAADAHGVHANAGVGGRMLSLLADGGSFNGQQVDGVGTDRVAALVYEAITHLLGPTSDYEDLYWVLGQAAVNLSWSAAERGDLERAAAAVEIAPPGPPLTVFADSFEAADAFSETWTAWDLSGTGVTWGPSTYRASDELTSAWCADGGTTAGSPGTTYAPRMRTWLLAGPVSLAGATHAWLSFDLWLHSELDADHVWAAVSTDGQNFKGIALSGPPRSPTGWVREVVDLRQVPGAIGAPKVWIGFYFGSDSGNQLEGAYVDRVLLRSATTSSCAGEISPSSVPLSGAGGEGSVTVTVPEGCAWQARSSAPWLSVTEDGQGVGPGSFTLSAGPNPDGRSRTAGVMVAGRVATVEQSPGSDSCTPPEVLVQPLDLQVPAGTRSDLVVEATGSAPLSYQWFMGPAGGGRPVAEATGASYLTPPLLRSARYWVRVSNACGSVSSDTATLTLTAALADAHNLFVPAVAHNRGAIDTDWRTDVVAVNPASTPASITLTFYNVDGSGPVTRLAKLDGGGTARWEDVLVSLFDLPPSTQSQGILHVLSDHPIVVAGRTYNRPTAGETFGQYAPALDDRDALPAGATGVLPMLEKSSGVRTNLGVVNLAGDRVDVRVKVFGPDGTQVGDDLELDVPAYRWVQVVDILGAVHAAPADLAYATVVVEAEEGLVWAYASVVDNATGDPTTIPVRVP